MHHPKRHAQPDQGKEEAADDIAGIMDAEIDAADGDATGEEEEKYAQYPFIPGRHFRIDDDIDKKSEKSKGEKGMTAREAEPGHAMQQGIDGALAAE